MERSNRHGSDRDENLELSDREIAQLYLNGSVFRA
jgi:hypothetical protein